MQLGDPADVQLPASPSSIGLSRRRLLQAGIATLGAGAALWPGVARAQPDAPAAPSAQPPAPAKARTAKNLIFMVADGMSTGALSIADLYGRYTGRGPTHWTRLARTPQARVSMMSTFSADSAVTDSAAASAAWSTGIKHLNRVMGFSPSGDELVPLLIRAKAGGKVVGCVTTTSITHATPAGWYCNIDNRDKEPIIAEQLLAREIDVALGGGSKFFADNFEAANPRVKVVRTRDELKAVIDGTASQGQRLLGLFNSGHMSMKLDRSPTEPGLLDMTKAAIARLNAIQTDGFVLQVEGGRVDHAGHTNDAASLVADLLEFDDTIAHVAQWVAQRDDTLLIVTTDHATANPGITIYGREGIDGLRKLKRAKHSIEWIFAQVDAAKYPDKAAHAEAIVATTKLALDIDLGDAGRATLTAALSGTPVDPFVPRNKLASVLGSLIANQVGVSWISPDHSGDMVNLMALGAGSRDMPGMIDNTELHDFLVKQLAIAAG